MQKKYFILFLFSFVVLYANAQKDTFQFKKLVWSDEFNYQGSPDEKKWNYEVGFVRNKEPQYYTKHRLENCRVEHGILVIEAKKENYKNAEYTSSSIHTRGIAEFQFGRMEIRAKVPKGKGVWSAFWMLGANRGDVKWPNCGEIDVMEYVGKDSGNVYGTVHFSNMENKYLHEGRKPFLGDPSLDFHVYAVEWNADSISFFYDSLKYFVFHIDKTDKSSQAIFHKKFYLLLNLALGRLGTLGGPLNDKVLPASYFVDYVRVYQ